VRRFLWVELGPRASLRYCTEGMNEFRTRGDGSFTAGSIGLNSFGSRTLMYSSHVWPPRRRRENMRRTNKHVQLKRRGSVDARLRTAIPRVWYKPNSITLASSELVRSWLRTS